MTPEEKIALLKEAGVWDVIGFPTCIDKLIDLVTAYEREACAKVCEDKHDYMCSRAAAAIRARSN